MKIWKIIFLCTLYLVVGGFFISDSSALGTRNWTRDSTVFKLNLTSYPVTGGFLDPADQDFVNFTFNRKFGLGLFFNATSQLNGYLVSNESTRFFFTKGQNMTWEGWSYDAVSDSVGRTLMSMWDGGGTKRFSLKAGQFFVGKRNMTFTDFTSNNSAPEDKIMASNIDLGHQGWFHWAIEYYNSSYTGSNKEYIRWYLNGTLMGTLDNVNLVVNTDRMELRLGGSQNQQWLGGMDEVRVSNRTRYSPSGFTPSEFQFVVDSSTVALYHFGDFESEAPLYYLESNNITVPPNFNEPYRISIKWNDTFITGLGILSKVYLETNSSGTTKNYTLDLPPSTGSHFFNTTNYSILGPVIFYWKFHANDTESKWRSSPKRLSNISGAVCVDIIHPDWGINIRCGHKKVTFDFNVSFFRDQIFNGSVQARNFTFAGVANQSIGILMHQEDLIENVTLDLTGFVSGGTFPNDVNVYINGTLSNTIGLVLYNATTNIDAFGFEDPDEGWGISSEDTGRNATFVTEEINLTAYIRLPKSAEVSSAKVNISGFQHRIGGNRTGQYIVTYTSGQISGATVNQTYTYSNSTELPS